MDKLIIGLLVVAAGTGVFFLLLEAGTPVPFSRLCKIKPFASS